MYQPTPEEQKSYFLNLVRDLIGVRSSRIHVEEAALYVAPADMDVLWAFRAQYDYGAIGVDMIFSDLEIALGDGIQKPWMTFNRLSPTGMSDAVDCLVRLLQPQQFAHKEAKEARRQESAFMDEEYLTDARDSLAFALTTFPHIKIEPAPEAPLKWHPGPYSMSFSAVVNPPPEKEDPPRVTLPEMLDHARELFPELDWQIIDREVLARQRTHFWFMSRNLSPSRVTIEIRGPDDRLWSSYAWDMTDGTPTQEIRSKILNYMASDTGDVLLDVEEELRAARTCASVLSHMGGVVERERERGARGS